MNTNQMVKSPTEPIPRLNKTFGTKELDPRLVDMFLYDFLNLWMRKIHESNINK